jgi:hypothetical protein
MTHVIADNNNLNNPVELPSIEAIERMDREREKAIESEIFGDSTSVKCQKCGVAVPMVVGLTATNSKSNRISTLEKSLRNMLWSTITSQYIRCMSYKIALSIFSLTRGPVIPLI